MMMRDDTSVNEIKTC